MHKYNLFQDIKIKGGKNPKVLGFRIVNKSELVAKASSIEKLA